MRRLPPRIGLTVFAALFAAAALPAQQAPDSFRWIDFHSPKDQDVVTWVTRALAVEDWTAIREIAVEYDAALVVTTKRANPQSQPTADAVSVWNVSLTNHLVTPLVTGVNLRWLDWMRFSEGAPFELAVLYDNCHDCDANTYFTAFNYDMNGHTWAARWVRGGQGVPMWSANKPPGVQWTQAYAAIAEPNGREYVATWSHFDYDNKKPSNDVLYRYDVDPISHLDRVVQLTGDQADSMVMRLCRAQDVVPTLERGLDAPACQQVLKTVPDRKPVTTPPANARGQSAAPRPRQPKAAPSPAASRATGPASGPAKPGSSQAKPPSN